MDTTRLRDGLRAYIDALQIQLSDMREQGERLSMSWSVTREVYQGDGADAFAGEFERASKMISEYVETLEQVLPLIIQRLAALDQFDANSVVLGGE